MVGKKRTSFPLSVLRPTPLARENTASFALKWSQIRREKYSVCNLQKQTSNPLSI